MTLLAWGNKMPFYCDNRIFFEIQFSPYDSQAMQDFYSLSIDYYAVISVSGASGMVLEDASYRPNNGTLLLTYLYTQDIHGKTISLVFNTSLVPQLSEYDELSESVYLGNTAGTLITHEAKACAQLEGPLMDSGVMVAGTYLGLLFLCVVFRGKIIGLELLGVLQVAFYSLANAEFVHFLLVPFLRLKPFVAGYNADLLRYPSSYLTDNHFVPYRVEAMGFTQETTLNFFANINVMIILAVCLPLAALALRLAGLFFERLATASQYVMKEAFVTLMLFCAVGFGFGCGLHLNFERGFFQKYTDEQPYDKAVKLNYLLGNFATMAAITLTFSACVLLELGEKEGFGEYRSWFRKDAGSARSYITLTMAYRFLLGFFMGALSGSPNSNIPSFVFTALVLAFLGVVRPFKERIQNIRAIAAHGCILAVLTVGLYGQEATRKVPMGVKARNLAPPILEWLAIGGIGIFSGVCVGMLIFEKVRRFLKKRKLQEYVYGNKAHKEDRSDANIIPAESVEGFD